MIVSSPASQGETGDRQISASDNSDRARKVKERGPTIRKKRREGERDGVNCSFFSFTLSAPWHACNDTTLTLCLFLELRLP